MICWAGRGLKPVCWQVILEMVKHMKKFDGASTFWHLPPDERKALMNMVRRFELARRYPHQQSLRRWRQSRPPQVALHSIR